MIWSQSLQQLAYHFISVMSHDIIVLNFILTILHNIFLFEDNLHKVLPFNVSIVL